MTMINPLDWNIFIAALCVWREASGEGEVGMRAVAHVIENRARKTRVSYASVVSAHNQFSSMTIKGDSQTVRWPYVTDGTFQQAIAAMELVTTLPTEQLADADITNGATFYWNPATATSTWFADAVKSGKLVKTAVIGHHEFYKET